MKKCKNCALQEEKPCMECSMCMSGDNHFRPIPKATKQTNADRIRAMSDEGLATTLVDWDFCSDVCSQKYVDSPFKDKCPENCKEQALEWLQQPAEEEKL